MTSGDMKTYPVMDNGLDGVFQFLDQSVALQDVDDSNVEQKSFTLAIASGNSTGSIKDTRSQFFKWGAT